MLIRKAILTDLESIREIYNQGIEDRIATLETDAKDIVYMQNWFDARQGRYVVHVAEMNSQIVGWASVGPYNSRCAYQGVGDLSIYIQREHRGQGIGQELLKSVEEEAKKNDFYKIVLFTFPFNVRGQGLYHKAGYREVGIFKNQGILDGRFVDVMAMEKLLNRSY